MQGQKAKGACMVSVNLVIMRGYVMISQDASLGNVNIDYTKYYSI